MCHLLLQPIVTRRPLEMMFSGIQILWQPCFKYFAKNNTPLSEFFAKNISQLIVWYLIFDIAPFPPIMFESACLGISFSISWFHSIDRITLTYRLSDQISADRSLLFFLKVCIFYPNLGKYVRITVSCIYVPTFFFNPLICWVYSFWGAFCKIIREIAHICIKYILQWDLMSKINIL